MGCVERLHDQRRHRLSPGRGHVLGGEVLEREGGIEFAQRLGDDVVHGVVDHRGVGSHDAHARRHARPSSRRRAITSRTRTVPWTSCTRTIRQPAAIPSAVAASDGSRRSLTGRSNMTPRKVLFDAESRSGAPSPASRSESRRSCSDCAAVFPRSRPASTTMRSSRHPRP